jgi:DNA excision repair protein ERCC-4
LLYGPKLFLIEILFLSDGLAVVGRGLGIVALLAKFLRVYCVNKGSESEHSVESDGVSGGSARRLVFCLNASGMETALCDYLLRDGVPPSMLPGVITNKQNLQTRRLLYSQGGCYFTTARIMIVDLLTEKILPTQICGILLFNAHRITETSIEAFILKIFKHGNPEGFVKVWSISF